MSGNTRKMFRSLIVSGAYAILRSKLLVESAPFNGPPILILSYPRSGSSWVGKILSTSPTTAYLREPITQQYIFKHGGRFALIDIQNNPKALSIYQKLSDEAFRGIPPRHPEVINNLRDFAYPQRKGKRILIKEVNPRAVHFYYDRYRPKVVLLLRHPAAIALSFYQLGWLDSSDVQMDTGNPKANAWEKFGYAYGTILHNAIEYLKSNGDHEIVVYRHLAEDPYNEYKKLFKKLDLKVPVNYDAVISKYCYSSKQSVPRAEIERTSRNMVFKWKEELSDKQIDDLYTGFLKSKLEYYRDAKEWDPSDSGANS